MKKRILVVIIALALLVACLVGCAPQEFAVIPDNEMATLTDNNFARSSADDLRIMSSNVLVDIKGWGGEPVLDRANRLSIAIKQYLPDVIAAQEFNKTWYKQLPDLISASGYQVIEEKYSAFMENRSPIIYNSNVLELKDHGIHKYSKGDNNGCRVASWAVFERKTDKKVFATISTHFNFMSNGADAGVRLEIMNSQAKELKEQAAAIVAKYNCPIFLAGDFNSMEKRDKYLDTEYYGAVSQAVAAASIYEKLVTDYTDSKYCDGVVKHDVGGGILPNGAWDSPTWDHIFYLGDSVEVKSFAILSALYFQRYEDDKDRVSDHLPIFADFRI